VISIKVAMIYVLLSMELPNSDVMSELKSDN